MEKKHGGDIMKVGYLRKSNDIDDYRYQKRKITNQNCDKVIVEEFETQFDYENSALKKGLSEMNPGDILIIETFRALGFTLLQALPFLNELEERQIDLKILDIKINTSHKHGELFELIRYLQESDRIINNEKLRLSGTIRKKKKTAGAKGLNQADIDKIISLRKQGKTLEEIVDITGKSFATVQKYTKSIAVQTGLSQEKIDEIIRLKKEGKKLVEIAEIAGVGYKTAQKYARSVNIQGRKLPTAKINSIKKLRKEGKSYAEIAEIAGVTNTTAHKYAKNVKISED